jgi:hypothetical protein
MLVHLGTQIVVGAIVSVRERNDSRYAAANDSHHCVGAECPAVHPSFLLATNTKVADRGFQGFPAGAASASFPG